MTSHQLRNLGKLTALISFIIGTLIFGAYILTPKAELIFIGYFYILLAGLINLVVLVIIFLRANKENKLIRTCGLILLNIPIAIFYCWIVSYMVTHDPNNYY